MATKLQERLKISEKRFEILQEAIKNEFVSFTLNENGCNDVIDVIEKVRELSISASEDILICYSVGALQYGFMKKHQQ